MAKKRKNGEGTWGKKTVKGVQYKYFRDSNGKYFYGKTEKEINEKRKDYNKNTIKDTTTFGDYLLWYYTNIVKDSISTSTYADYIRTCKIIINSEHYNLGNIQLCSFTYNNNYFLNYIRAITPHYSLNYIRSHYTRIKVAVKYAEKMGKIEKGLFDEIKLPRESNVGKMAKKVPFLSKEIADNLYMHIYDKYYNGNLKYGYYYWIMLLVIHTGMRSEELRAIRLDDVDFDNATLKIDEAIVKVKQEDDTYKYILKETKNHQSRRIIPLNSIAIEMLKNIIEYTKPKKSSDLICYNTKHGYVKNTRLSVATDRILRDINSPVSHCSPHALRHTFGSILYENGVDLKTISELMGHKNISTTADIYIGLSQRHLADSVDVLEPNFNKEEK